MERHDFNEAAARLNEARLEALVELNRMTGAPLQEITDFALEAAVQLTQSTMGYLAFMNSDESVLTMHSWSKSAMAQCAIIDKPIVYPVATTGLWGEAVRQRKPILTNDYQAENPLKKGCPKGHVPVTRHMNAPVFDGDRIVIVAGVGNKTAPYDDTDVRQLTLLMQGMWQLLQRRRSQERLAHLNAVLRAVRGVNQLISREKRRDRLLEGVCRCMVEARGYHQAWAFLRSDSEAFSLWAESGVGPSWPQLVQRMQQGYTPPCITRCLNRPGMAVADQKRCRAAACPLWSTHRDTDVVVVRVQHLDRVYGVLAGTLPHGLAEDPEEQSLLQEIGEDFGFALHGVVLEEQRAAAEDSMRRQTAVLRGINDVFQEALTCDTDVEVANKCLAIAEKLTGSEFGFVQEINERGRADTIALTDPGWRACRIPESNAVKALRDMEIRGIWAQAMKEKRSVIVNDPESHPSRVGVPEGHPLLRCFLGVPLRHGATVIGSVGLANKPSGYDAADRQAIEALAGGFVEALMRKRAEQALRTAHDELEVRVRDRTADLTRVNAELELSRQAAEAASRAKSTFLANMSHEIRTPLNAVIGMTELVLRTQLSPQQREFLLTVRDSGEALLSVINDILDFSKIEAGKLVLDRQPFDLRERVGDTMRSFALRAHQAGLELACFIRADVPHMVVGDYPHLRQIVVNLVANALRFTEQGEVTLEVAVESRSETDAVLHCTVNDTGVGIPPEKQAAIFEMFEQADATITRRRGGTGLGLAIASRLVNLMDGRIWVESEAGCGSRFHFTVRLDLAETEPREAVHPEPECLHGLRVLVVDDHATNRRILEEVLRSWQMRPTLACCAAEAIGLLREAQRTDAPYRLVLTDAHMPEMDGFTLAEQIQRDPQIGSAVVMMLTSGSRDDDPERCRKLGIASYLLKPVKHSELLEAIEEALGIAASDEAVPATNERPANGGLRILLVEDSQVNQQLASALLEGEGHTVAVANTGREALAVTETGPFDLVLMDVQMPEMDGLEATAAIRRRERGTGRHLPILAMTAHALQGDRERCLAAGMDGYLAKPIRVRELFEAIERLVAGPEPPAAPAATREAAIDWPAALKNLQSNPALLRTVVEAATEEIPRLMASIRRAADASDATALRLAAHTLKGSVRYFGPGPVYEQAERLEGMAREGKLTQAKEVVADLEEAVVPVTRALAEYLREA